MVTSRGRLEKTDQDYGCRFFATRATPRGASRFALISKSPASRRRSATGRSDDRNCSISLKASSYMARSVTESSFPEASHGSATLLCPARRSRRGERSAEGSPSIASAIECKSDTSTPRDNATRSATVFPTPRVPCRICVTFDLATLKISSARTASVRPVAFDASIRRATNLVSGSSFGTVPGVPDSEFTFLNPAVDSPCRFFQIHYSE